MRKVILMMTTAFSLIVFSGAAISATINDKFQAYGLFIGVYESPQYLSDECARRYPLISSFAASVKRDYIRTNKDLFASTETFMAALLMKERGASLEEFKELLEQLRPDLDRNVKIGMQQYIGSQNLCSAALNGINQGKMDLSIKTARQLEIIHQ